MDKPGGLHYQEHVQRDGFGRRLQSIALASIRNQGVGMRNGKTNNTEHFPCPPLLNHSLNLAIPYLPEIRTFTPPGRCVLPGTLIQPDSLFFSGEERAQGIQAV